MLQFYSRRVICSACSLPPSFVTNHLGPRLAPTLRQLPVLFALQPSSVSTVPSPCRQQLSEQSRLHHQRPPTPTSISLTPHRHLLSVSETCSFWTLYFTSPVALQLVLVGIPLRQHSPFRRYTPSDMCFYADFACPLFFSPVMQGSSDSGSEKRAIFLHIPFHTSQSPAPNPHLPITVKSLAISLIQNHPPGREASRRPNLGVAIVVFVTAACS